MKAIPRGSQITIGAKSPKDVQAFTFQMPEKDPIEDGEVMEAHDLIAKIEKAVEPYKSVVDTAKVAVDQIEEGIRATFRERLEEESTDGERQLRFVDIEARPPESSEPTRVGELAAKAARNFSNSVSKSNLDSVTVTAGGKSVTIQGRGRKRGGR